MFRLFPVVLLSLFVLPLSAAAAEKNIMEMLKEDSRFKELTGAIEKARLNEHLAGDGPVTFFAPTDEALSKMNDWNNIKNDETKLAAYLKNHVILKEKITSANPGREVTALSGKTVKFDPNAKKYGEASIMQPDWEAKNGVVHVVDSTLMPEDKSASAATNGGLLKNWIVDPVKSLLGTSPIPVTASPVPAQPEQSATADAATTPNSDLASTAPSPETATSTEEQPTDSAN